MTDTINAVGSRLATVDIVRMPDGTVHGRLVDMDPRLIETTCADEPDDRQAACRLLQVADWTIDAAVHFTEEAERLLPDESR